MHSVPVIKHELKMEASGLISALETLQFPKYLFSLGEVYAIYGEAKAVVTRAFYRTKGVCLSNILLRIQNRFRRRTSIGFTRSLDSLFTLNLYLQTTPCKKGSSLLSTITCSLRRTGILQYYGFYDHFEPWKLQKGRISPLAPN